MERRAVMRDTVGRYHLGERIGVGGMGEVYRARDERLGRDVAVKLLPDVFAVDADRVRRFELEARAAAALSHPNILAVYDVGEQDGRPYIVTELLEGETLRDRIVSGTLGLRRAVELAVQLARGLAAAHEKGIVHRDLKPDNVFVTADGTVKILDFGLAKLTEARSPGELATRDAPPGTDVGTVLGTAGYMAPEQIRCRRLDARTDIFAFGCVLYEMLSGQRAFAGETPADTMSAILHRDPAPLSRVDRPVPAPLERVVLRCLEKRPDDRFSSTGDLAHALHAVAASEELPQAAAEPPPESSPYPGLAAFTEADAEHFFGREAEVAGMWERIPGRPMLALIGPSGAGKSSFLRAGLLPHAPPGWRCVVATPGQSPFKGLARALIPEVSGELVTMQHLLDFDDSDTAVGVFRAWRQRHDHALVVVDQLEELFTLNPPDAQAAFGALLGRLADEAGVHVLLAMRDDFFFECSRLPPLAGVFEEVTPLKPPAGDALRQALVRPAETHGVAFEDDALVDEMLGAVEGTRGALPMLAFAAARLWEMRDRTRGLVTREVYEHIGGVAGALAQHAEAVLQRVGERRLPIVREIFRNLVTAQGTRAVMEANELLSVFPGERREAAEAVLEQLVDARLLTRFEEDGVDDDAPRHRRVEIVHESLLAAWPRLVRWQTQDADGARLRDEVRQAARVWEEHGRSDDYLWTGSAYREFSAWRERYPGRLSEGEEAFSRAMEVLERRRRRLRKVALVAGFATLVSVAIVFAALWHRSVQEARRAEASKILTLARFELESDRSNALAYTIASLDTADTSAARRFAVAILWQGPTATVLPPRQHPPWSATFSPDGRWLATGHWHGGLSLWPASGGDRVVLAGHDDGTVGSVEFSDDSRLLLSAASVGPDPLTRLWSVPDGSLVRTFADLDERRAWRFAVFEPGARSVLTALITLEKLYLRRWSVDGGKATTLGTVPAEGSWSYVAVDRSRSHIAFALAHDLYVYPVDAFSQQNARLVGTHEGTVMRGLAFDPMGRWLVAGDDSKHYLMWPLDPPQSSRPRLLDGRFTPWGNVVSNPQGTLLAAATRDGTGLVWDLTGPPDARPVTFNRKFQMNAVAFHPQGRWLAATNSDYLTAAGELTLWGWSNRRPRILSGHESEVGSVAFSPDGKWLASSGMGDGKVRLWPLTPSAGDTVRTVLSRKDEKRMTRVEFTPDGRFLIAVSLWGAWKIPVAGPGPAEPIAGALGGAHLALDESGHVLLTSRFGDAGPFTVAVSNLDDGSYARIDTGCRATVSDMALAPDGSLLVACDDALFRVDLATGARERLLEGGVGTVSLARDGRRLLVVGRETLTLHDLATGSTRRLDTWGKVDRALFDRTGTIAVASSPSGAILVGDPESDTPYLLFGHPSGISWLATSPDNQWIASGGEDGTVRLWPMPDFSHVPLQTMPFNRLMAVLRGTTNLRAVADAAAPTGYRIQPDYTAYRGWQQSPEW